MSRQTSLQRADQKSPECHHLFSVVGIRSGSEAKIPRKSSPAKKPLISGDATAMPKTKLKYQG